MWRGAFLVGVMGLTSLFFTFHVSTTPPPAPDYDVGKSWLCRPARDDACAKPTTATVFEEGAAKDAGKKVETYKPNPLALVDCFYLYPTVSRAHDAYSPIEITKDETAIVRNQLARFGAVCRPFAPLYRQVTVAGLPGLFRGEKYINLQTPYKDVLTAWKTYLAKDNDGRGIVLIGHSQGARLLAKLMADEIDGKPIQSRLVAAILPGAEIDVPTGRDVGGSFEHIPLCSSAAKTGCVIAYSSFPADKPVPANARFGAASVTGAQYACVDPAALADASSLAADLPLTDKMKETLKTDFLELPGAIHSACRKSDRFNVLAINSGKGDVMGETTDALLERLADYSPRTGLHALDVNLALGTLVDLMRDKAKSFPRH